MINIHNIISGYQFSSLCMSTFSRIIRILLDSMSLNGRSLEQSRINKYMCASAAYPNNVYIERVWFGFEKRLQLSQWDHTTQVISRVCKWNVFDYISLGQTERSHLLQTK
jgi:hypothetical protein